MKRTDSETTQTIKKDKHSNTFIVSMIFLICIKTIAIYAIYNIRNLSNDIAILGIIIALSYISNKTNRILHHICNTINTLLLLLFTIDSYIILYYKSRLSLVEIFEFTKNINNTSFSLTIMYGIIAFIFFVFICSHISQYISSLYKKLNEKYKIKEKYTIYIHISSISIALIIILRAIEIGKKTGQEKTKIEMNFIEYQMNFTIKKDKFTESKNKKSTKKYEDYFTYIKGQNKKPNILLIFAESFSAIDSKRVAGIHDNFPLLDKIQEEGTTFKNMYANGCTSETSHIATLQGIEAREHPSMTKENAYSEYSSLNQTLPLFLEENGYTTTFLSTVTLSFLNQRSFLEKIGFNTIYGEETFPQNNTYTFGAEPDEVLYERALEIIKKQNIKNNTPYFLAMQTISSHEPYNSPYGKGEEASFRYADEKIYDFYQKIKKTDFFKNGILIILGDHRKIDTIEEKEKTLYGNTASSRIIGTIVGKDIQAGNNIEKPIQHIDIYYSLKELIGNNNVLVRKKYNNIFNKEEKRDRAIRYCRYYISDNGYVVMRGNTGEKLEENDQNKENKEIYNYINAYKEYQYNNWLLGKDTKEDDFLSGNFTKKLLKDIK